MKRKKLEAPVFKLIGNAIVPLNDNAEDLFKNTRYKKLIVLPWNRQGLITQNYENTYWEIIFVEKEAEVFYFILNNITEQYLEYDTLHKENDRNKLKVEELKIFNSKYFEERERLMKIISSGIAHQINNPLALIKSGVNYMNEGLKDIGNKIKDCGDQLIVKRIYYDLEDLNETYLLINDGVDRIAKIIKRLNIVVELSKGEKIVLYDLNKLISEVLFYVKDSFENKNIKAELNKGNIIKISGRKNRIKNVLIQVLKNAFENTKDKIVIKTFMKGEKIVVVVCNNGEKIPDWVKLNLFNPFVTSREFEGGVGLGLFFAKQVLIEEHGHIEYYINANNCNCFKITIYKKPLL